MLSVRIRLGDIPEVAFRTRYGRGEFLAVFVRVASCPVVFEVMVCSVTATVLRMRLAG